VGGFFVAIPVCGVVAAYITLGFLVGLPQPRPMITLKLATSLDGRIATASGDSKWITGEQARAEAHSLRASHDAVLVGSGTALADDPALTCRLPGMKDRSPVRVIADSRLRLPLLAEVVRSADKVPTWVVTGRDSDAARRRDLVAAGVQVVEVASGSDARPDARAMATALAERGLTRVLLEGGGELATAFLRAGLIDRVAWFHAPRVVGGEGVPAVGELRISAVADAPSFLFRKVSAAGDDVLGQYVK
jgi:diaminohydroxyphosphoribosylaminopyrimidine deaminase/5-amino-6-(5-phosphoribosylamino)uracil reductase